MKDKGKSRRYLRPGTMVVIGVLIAVVMVVFAALEISHSRVRTRGLIFEKGVALIEQIEKSSALALRAGDEIEHELSRRLLGAARTASHLDQEGRADRETLDLVARRHEVLTLHLVDASGRIVMSNRKESHLSQGEARDFRDVFPGLFSGDEREAVLGVHSPRSGKGKRYSVAVRRQGGGIAIAGIDAETLSDFRRSFGFGRLIQDVGRVSGVVRVVIQDEEGIIAATSDVEKVDSIESDAFLSSAWESGRPASRLTSQSGGAVFEVVKRIELVKDLSGLLRIAFDGHEILDLESKARRRLIVTFLGLALLLAAAVNALIIFQNMTLIRRTRDEVATFSGAIIEGVADAVFVVAPDGSVRMANDRAARLFGGSKDVLPPELSGTVQRATSAKEPVIEEIVVSDGEGGRRELVVGGSRVSVEPESPPYVVLIGRDETEIRRMEKQMRRDEKVVAMGRLAGAVAHEIRNPLNAIGMTVQRLGLEFSPAKDEAQFRDLLKIVTGEIRRLDDIIGRFLQFAAAPVINPAPSDLGELARSAVSEVRGLGASRSIGVEVDAPEKVAATFDAKQIRQVLLNLLTNAIDACGEGGVVSLKVRVEEEQVLLDVADDGRGMDDEEQGRVFDLYFSTKEKGTGLGLPIALRIVQAHGGAMSVESAPGKGSTFRVRLPKEG